MAESPNPDQLPEQIVEAPEAALPKLALLGACGCGSGCGCGCQSGAPCQCGAAES
jgi:hypothetical protein